MEVVLLSVIVLILDGIFLSLNRGFFNKQLVSVQKSEVSMNAFGAIMAYIFIVMSLYFFIIREKKSVAQAFLLGLCIYGVYEYTNYAVFTNWRLKTTLVDTLWGGILFALTTFLYYKIK